MNWYCLNWLHPACIDIYFPIWFIYFHLLLCLYIFFPRFYGYGWINDLCSDERNKIIFICNDGVLSLECVLVPFSLIPHGTDRPHRLTSHHPPQLLRIPLSPVSPSPFHLPPSIFPVLCALSSCSVGTCPISLLSSSESDENLETLWKQLFLCFLIYTFLLILIFILIHILSYIFNLLILNEFIFISFIFLNLSSSDLFFFKYFFIQFFIIQFIFILLIYILILIFFYL